MFNLVSFEESLRDFDVHIQYLIESLQNAGGDELVFNGHEFAGIYRGKDFLGKIHSPFDSQMKFVIWMQLLARSCGVHLDVANPSCGGEIKESRYRWHAVLPSLSRGRPLFCLRAARFGSFSFADFGIGDHEKNEMIDLIQHANGFVVSGFTNCGKSSFLHLLLTTLYSTRRVVVVESVSELKIQYENWIGLNSRHLRNGAGRIYETSDLVAEALRLRPDCIVIGEIRGQEALSFLETLSIGMNGGATIHASSPKNAVSRIIALASMAKGKIPVAAYSNGDSKIAIIQMDRDKRIKEVSLERLHLHRADRLQ